MIGITYTTRNRSEVLAYSLSKLDETLTNETVIVIDDASECAEQNEAIVKRFGFTYLLNKKRLGIPRSKERGFRCLQHYDFQFWFDDDCFPLPGWQDRFTDAMKHQGHLLYLREWCNIKKLRDLGHDIVEYSGATACLMTFRKDMYKDIHGFSVGFGKYGVWHHTLSTKMHERGYTDGHYLSVKSAHDYIHSFDIDEVPEDFNVSFGSSISLEERQYEIEIGSKKHNDFKSMLP